MELIYKKYVIDETDENGVLKSIKFKYNDDFNFGFDVIDALGDKIPGKRAMVWVSERGEEKVFTFRDIKVYSSKAANYFKSLGIKKGDRVMLILKRDYQFWYAINGLHKVGAIAIPATHLLTKEDLIYRFNAAGVKAVVCVGEEPILTSIENALPHSPTVTILSITKTHRKGWDNFDDGVEKASDYFPRSANSNKADDLMLMYFTSGTRVPKDFVAQLYIPAWARVHGKVLAQRRPRRAAPDGVRHGLGKIHVGQALRPVAVRGVHFHL